MPTRREFIKRSAAVFFSWPLILANLDSKRIFTQKNDLNSEVLGRVLFNNTPTYMKPDKKSESNGSYQFNDVVSLSQPITGQSLSQNNNIWFGLEDKSFIHMQSVQLVKNQLNEPHEDIVKSGRLAEITVPFSEAWPADKQNTRSHQIFFYGSTHWVHGLGKNRSGTLYYFVKEDRWNETYYIETAHMRIIEDEELLPISPDVDLESKSILINTKDQILIAYEDGIPVMVSAVSTGIFNDGKNLSTPLGDFSVNYKRPSRHMVHSDKIGVNDNELYGVPWVTYFTDSGIAFHGTYWHNDYTQPHSHGCVNMPIHAAKWLYLWTDPVVPPREMKYVSSHGTSVKVI